MFSYSSKVVFFGVFDYAEAQDTLSVEKLFGFSLTNPKFERHQVGLVTENLYSFFWSPKMGKKESRSQEAFPYFLWFNLMFTNGWELLGKPFNPMCPFSKGSHRSIKVVALGEHQEIRYKSFSIWSILVNWNQQIQTYSLEVTVLKGFLGSIRKFSIHGNLKGDI